MADLSESADAILSRLQARLAPLGALVTETDLVASPGRFDMVRGSDTARLRALGIVVENGGADCVFLVDAEGRSYGKCVVDNQARNSVVVLGKPHRKGVGIKIVFQEDGCAFVAPDLAVLSNRLGPVMFSGKDQLFFFGERASSLGMSARLLGAGRIVAIGDGCMLSSKIAIRTADMHTLFDVATGALVGKGAVDAIIERRVWIGNDVALQSATRIGYGSMIGSRALVTGDVPPCALMVGVPARAIRTGIGWSRERDGVTQADRDEYAVLGALAAASTAPEG